MDSIIPILSEFGFPATAFGVIVYLIFTMMRGHKEERIEWRDVINNNVERYDIRQKETNEILSKLHVAIDKSISQK